MSDKEQLLEFLSKPDSIVFKDSGHAIEILEADGNRGIEFLFNSQGKLITHVFYGNGISGNLEYDPS